MPRTQPMRGAIAEYEAAAGETASVPELHLPDDAGCPPQGAGAIPTSKGAAMTSPITGTDFITVATRDLDAAVDFYGGVLGLAELKRWGRLPAVEFETGNLTIAVMQSEA